MRKTILVAVLFLGTGIAHAAGGQAGTSIDFIQSTSSCVDFVCTAEVKVRVSSNKQACVAGRKVEFYARYSGEGKMQIDTDRANRDGYARGRGEVDEQPDGYSVKAPATKVENTRCAVGKKASG